MITTVLINTAPAQVHDGIIIGRGADGRVAMADGRLTYRTDYDMSPS